MMAAAGEQRRVVFDGDVQGVGFRYTACRLSEGYDVTGYVRNLPDGRVECLVEGDKDQIDRFLADLSGRMAHYIRRTTQQSAPAAGGYPSFTVRF
jgi:acylphosphatase